MTDKLLKQNFFFLSLNSYSQPGPFGSIFKVLNRRGSEAGAYPYSMHIQFEIQDQEKT